MRPRRKYERFVRRLETEFVGQEKQYRAISSDFSRYGLFIRTNHAFVPGTELDVVIHLPTGVDCKLKGVVRRAMKTPIVSLKNGMGIELTRRDQNYIKFLKEFDPTEDGIPDTFAFEKPVSAEPDYVIIACSQCKAKNRVRRERLSHSPKCGKCSAPISL